MTLANILVFCLLGVLFGLARQAWRGWLLFGASVLCVYALQPATPIRHLDFWLPSASLGLVVVVWAATLPAGGLRQRVHKTDWVSLGVLFLLVLAAAGVNNLSALAGYDVPLLPSPPPDESQILFALGLLCAFFLLGAASGRTARLVNLAAALLVGLLLLLFLILKVESLAALASAWLRWFNGQDVALANALDLRWLGFSYIAFRLIHVLRDRVNGRLPELALRDMLTYAVFFPALTAGPIDRCERFSKDLQNPFHLDWGEAGMAFRRILAGVFKKFVLADSLSLVSLNAQNAVQISSTGWLWVLVYLYSLQIFLDFSGYTDIAIGIGRLMGVRLPENFNRPYLQKNLTTFWNCWHITLTQWLRAYFFNPLTRSLRSKAWIPAGVTLFSVQFSTMLLIGLWHGVTWNFFFWGLWHAIGLFLHNRWQDWARQRTNALDTRPRLQKAAHVFSVLLTFHYVTLGWVWFCLPSPQLSWEVLQRLFRIG